MRWNIDNDVCVNDFYNATKDEPYHRNANLYEKVHYDMDLLFQQDIFDLVTCRICDRTYVKFMSPCHNSSYEHQNACIIYNWAYNNDQELYVSLISMLQD